MAVIQPTLEISEKALSGLSNGDYFRRGGVIYNKTGGIVEHAKDILVPKQKQISNTVTMTNVIIGLGTLIAVTGVTFYTVQKHKRKQANKTETETPKCIKDYNASLLEYLNAIRNRELTTDIIDRLVYCLDQLKQNNSANVISIDFSLEQLSLLQSVVFDYTQKLAEVNSYTLNDPPKNSDRFIEGNIVNLQHWLMKQRDILGHAF